MSQSSLSLPSSPPATTRDEHTTEAMAAIPRARRLRTGRSRGRGGRFPALQRPAPRPQAPPLGRGGERRGRELRLGRGRAALPRAGQGSFVPGGVAPWLGRAARRLVRGISDSGAVSTWSCGAAHSWLRCFVGAGRRSKATWEVVSLDLWLLYMCGFEVKDTGPSL